jgi:hypothetical protein
MEENRTEIAMSSLKRWSHEKGFELAVFPGVPFGPEVVLRVNKMSKPGEKITLDAEVLTEANGTKIVMVDNGGVTLLLGYELASDIADALRFHEMDERGQETEL